MESDVGNTILTSDRPLTYWDCEEPMSLGTSYSISSIGVGTLYIYHCFDYLTVNNMIHHIETHHCFYRYLWPEHLPDYYTG